MIVARPVAICMLLPMAALLLVSAAPAGWVERPGNKGSAQVYDSRTTAQTSVLVFADTPPAAADPRVLARTIAGIPVCPRTPPDDRSASGTVVVQSVAGDRRCIALVRTGADGKPRMALGMALGRGSMDAAALTAALTAFVGDTAEVAPAAALAPRGGDAPPIRGSGAAPLPVGAVMRGHMNFIGSPPMMSYTVTPWFLFPGGIATDCAKVDPARLELTLAALRARRDCTGARWRKAGGKVELQIDDDDRWTSDQIFEKPPVPRGTTLDFRGTTKSGAGFDNPYGSGGTSVLGSGGFVLTRDGRIETEMSSSVSFSSANAVASSSGRRAGVRGRYELDGYIIRIALDTGPVIERYVLFDKGTAAAYEHVYFEDTHYWLPGRR